METALSGPVAHTGLQARNELMERARDYAEAALSANTRKAYGKQWRRFVSWCDANGAVSLPASPAAVIQYVTQMADRERRALATIRLGLVAIAWAHTAAKLPNPVESPELGLVMTGIGKQHGSRQTKKSPLLVPALRQMVSAMPNSLVGKRDKALLLLGFAGALRRSELAAVEVAHLLADGEGMRVFLPRSKTDHEGKGVTLGIPFGTKLEVCPVRSVREWMEAAGISAGPIFRRITRAGVVGLDALTPETVARVVKKHAAAVGLDPKTFSGHSMRAGFVTAAAKAGRAEWSIMRHSRHQNLQIMRGYIREANLFRDNAAKGLL